ncbi:MAG: hypothetical protein V1806_05595 [Pseudomonadota bacterium]
MASRDDGFLKSFTLREALVLAFCATFIILARATFRLHLNITGHAMFFTMFFLVLARGVVPQKGAALVVGLLAGVAAALLGLGKGGPLVLARFVLPALVVEVLAWLYPRLSRQVWSGCLAGALGGATRGLLTMAADWAVGMSLSLAWAHALANGGMNLIFGALGGALAPLVARRLEARTRG